MKKTLLTLTILLVSCSLVFAQDHEVSGTVTNPDGNAIPGISVHVKGSTNGTASDEKGQYVISVEDNAVLIFSGIGYNQKEIPVNGKSVVDVTIESGTQSLNELIVVGYSTTTKKAFTGTVKTVSAEDIEKKNVDDVAQALAGEVPGVRVINTSGQPGEVAKIRVRGFGSVNGNRD